MNINRPEAWRRIHCRWSSRAKYERHQMPNPAPSGWQQEHDTADTGDYICLTCGADWDRNGAKAGPQDAAVFLA
jgi:hypothetical protein